jgi:hypothetical protein
MSPRPQTRGLFYARKPLISNNNNISLLFNNFNGLAFCTALDIFRRNAQLVQGLPLDPLGLAFLCRRRRSGQNPVLFDNQLLQFPLLLKGQHGLLLNQTNITDLLQYRLKSGKMKGNHRITS